MVISRVETINPWVIYIISYNICYRTNDVKSNSIDTTTAAVCAVHSNDSIAMTTNDFDADNDAGDATRIVTRTSQPLPLFDLNSVINTVDYCRYLLRVRQGCASMCITRTIRTIRTMRTMLMLSAITTVLAIRYGGYLTLGASFSGITRAH